MASECVFPIKAIWYKCLVCQKCFELPDRFLTHRTESDCKFEYQKILKERSVIRSVTDLVKSEAIPEIKLDEQDDEVPVIVPNKPDSTSMTEQDKDSIDIEPNSLKSTPSKSSSIKKDCQAFGCSKCGKRSTRFNPCICSINNNPQHQNPNMNTCNVCEKPFASSAGLRMHIYAFHEVDKPFSCKECQKCFTQTSSLNFHLRNIHKRVKLSCKSCTRGFYYPEELEIHILEVHKP